MALPHFLLSSGNLHTDRRLDYARLLYENNEIDAAIDLLLQTTDLAEEWPVLQFTLGKYYAKKGQFNEAIEYFKKTLRLDPDDHQGAMLEIEILGVPMIEDAMPHAFVEALFDQYAPRFDEHLVEKLDYNVPQLISDIVGRNILVHEQQKILDLGCGTGLAAEYFVHTASWIEGIDLSDGMLEQARRKEIYHKLEHAELLQYLQNNDDFYDLIIAADVLSYFGSLEHVFTAARSRLSKAGHFVFTVQKLSITDDFSPDYNLDDQHRFSHNIHYLERAITQSGLHIVALEEHILRKDRGNDITGLLYVCSSEHKLLKESSEQYMPPKSRVSKRYRM